MSDVLYLVPEYTIDWHFLLDEFVGKTGRARTYVENDQVFGAIGVIEAGLSRFEFYLEKISDECWRWEGTDHLNGEVGSDFTTMADALAAANAFTHRVLWPGRSFLARY